MGIKSHIAKEAAKFLLHEVCSHHHHHQDYSYNTNYVSDTIDMNTLYEALNHAEQVCCAVNPTCKKEHLALFKSEVINYIHSK